MSLFESSLVPCVPPLWAKGGHAQTLMAHFLPSPKLNNLGKKWQLELLGGDKLAGRFYQGNTNYLVTIFHGLGGSIEADYMRRTASVSLSLGHSVLLVNHRGCGEGVGLAKEPYHSGRAEDVSAVVEWGRKEFPDKKQISIGYSLGANALLLLLSGQRGQYLPDFAIASNAPINLEKSAILLKQGLNKLYDIRFQLLCRESITSRKKAGLLAEDSYPFPKMTSLHDFDHFYTARASGFESREHYYETCSTYKVLDKIKIPTVILTAKDDPFVAVEDYAKAKVSDSVHLHIEDHGGHMGYLSKEKTPLGTTRWLDYAMKTYLENLVGL